MNDPLMPVMQIKIEALERQVKKLSEENERVRDLLTEFDRRHDVDLARAEAAEEDRDDALIALASARKQLERYIGEAEQLVAKLEAALVAAYRLGVRDGATHIFSMENDGSKPQWIHQGSWAHTIEQASHRARQTPTPTAEQLMARIKETGQ